MHDVKGRNDFIEHGHTPAGRAKVTYRTYLASTEQLLYIPSVELVVGWLRNTENFAFSFLIFLPFVDYIMLMWEKDTRLSPLSILEAAKSWAGPGHEASNNQLMGYSLHEYTLVDWLWLSYSWLQVLQKLPVTIAALKQGNMGKLIKQLSKQEHPGQWDYSTITDGSPKWFEFRGSTWVAQQ